MNKKKMDIGLRYVMILLLTTFLLVSLSFGWYVSNQEVSADGITAESGSSNLEVTNHGIYRAVVGSEDKPYPDKADGNNPETLPGLFFGETIYYSVSVRSLDDTLKDIHIDINNINGNEFFTLPPVLEATEDQARVEIGTYTTKRKTYENNIGVEKTYTYKTYTSNNDTLMPKGPNGETITNGEYFRLSKDGLPEDQIPQGEEAYRYYIYQGKKDGKDYRYNTTDIYKFKLYDIFVGTGDTYERLLKPDGSRYQADKHYSLIRPNGLLPTIDTFNVYNFPNWKPVTAGNKIQDTITFKFEILFDENALVGTGIDFSSLSNKYLILNTIRVTSSKPKEVV